MRGRRPSSISGCRAYLESLPVAEAKFKDLSKMCNMMLIPKEYHYFYRNLMVDKKVRDALPEPNFSEDSDSNMYISE